MSAVTAALHEDHLTALSYNFDSTLLASGSLDHSIRISSSPDSSTSLLLPRAHDAPVLALDWANPTFGTLLASGGADGTIKLWKQELLPLSTTLHPPILSRSISTHPLSHSTHDSTTRFSLKATLTDPRGTIRDIEFSPPEFGLKLAAISTDSVLRIFECLDLISFAEWTLVHEIDLAGQNGASLLGGNGGASGFVKGFETGSPTKLPSLSSALSGGNLSAGSTAVGSHSSHAHQGGNNHASGASAALKEREREREREREKERERQGEESGRKGMVESDGGWSVSWCKECWWGERLAVTAGVNEIIRLFHFPPFSPWSNYLNLIPPPGSTSHHSVSSHTTTTASSSQPTPITSLSFSPSSGRSFQLLAAGGKEGTARIWKLYTPPVKFSSLESTTSFDESNSQSQTPVGRHHKKSSSGLSGKMEGEWRAELDSELVLDEGRKGNGGIGTGCVRVQWNSTGTVLSTAGDDAKVRLWKATYTGQWRVIAVLGTEEDENPTALNG